MVLKHQLSGACARRQTANGRRQPSMFLLAMLAAAQVTTGAPLEPVLTQIEDKVASTRHSGPQNRGKAAKPASDENYQAIISHQIFGRSCPPQRYHLTDWEHPLQFMLKTANDGKSVLIISGEFTEGDSDRLQEFIRTAPSITEVQFDSGGGNAAEGPKIGRVIRAAHLSTHVASGYACISSCSMAFLGGVLRAVDSDAIYGLHTFYNSGLYSALSQQTTKEGKQNFLHHTEQDAALTAGNIQEYGQEMGISRSFFTQVMFAQRSEIFISDERLGQLRAIFRIALSGQQANDVILALIKEGIVPYETEDDKSDANDFVGWAQSEHSQEEVDEKLAVLISSDFRCISESSLNRYNITNVVGQ